MTADSIRPGTSCAADPDPVAQMLEQAAELQAATDMPGVLRGAVACAVAATASLTGRGGRLDDQGATSHERYDVRAGWADAPRRWEAGEGAPGAACAAGAAVSLRGDAGPDEAQACVPILAAGVVVGFVLVAGRRDGYDAECLRRLQAIARLAEQRLHHVTAEERRRAAAARQTDIAQRLQRQLLPQAPPHLDGLDVAFEFRSASEGVLSGGDFVDYYLRPPSDNLAFVIGDVAGKGVEAMAHTFVAKFILRAAVHGGQVSWPTHPGAALQELRTGLLEQPDFSADSERFVTVLFGLIDPRRGQLQLSSAGHPTPFLVRPSQVERPLLLAEPAIGVELGAALEPYPTETISLRDGDVLVLFTDGIAELRDAGGGFFEDEMPAVLGDCHDLPAAQVVARLLKAAETFSARPPADDMALLCIRLRHSV